MKKFLLIAASTAFLLAGPVQEAEAQVHFGPQVVLWDFEELGLGARVDFGLADAFGIDEGFFQGLFATVNGNYVFNDIDDVNTLVFNLNAGVPFETDAAVTPYAGMGINHIRESGDFGSGTLSGLNVLGGLFFGLGDIPAFGELQYSTTGDGFLTASLGVLF